MNELCMYYVPCCNAAEAVLYLYHHPSSEYSNNEMNKTTPIKSLNKNHSSYLSPQINNQTKQSPNKTVITIPIYKSRDTA